MRHVITAWGEAVLQTPNTWQHHPSESGALLFLTRLYSHSKAISPQSEYLETSLCCLSFAMKPLWSLVTHPCSFSFINNNFVLDDQNHFKCLSLPLVSFLWCLETLLKLVKVKPCLPIELIRVILWTTATLRSWFGPNISPLVTVSPNWSRLANKTREPEHAT